MPFAGSQLNKPALRNLPKKSDTFFDTEEVCSVCEKPRESTSAREKPTKDLEVAEQPCGVKRVKVEAVEEGPLCLVCGWFGHDRHHCCTHPNDYNHERRDTRFKLNEAELLMHIQSFEKWNLNDLRDNRYNHNNPLNLMDMSDVLCRACGLFGHDEDYCFTPPCYYSEKARGPPIPRARRLLNWRFYGLPKFTVGNNNNNNNTTTTTTTTNNNNNTLMSVYS